MQPASISDVASSDTKASSSSYDYDAMPEEQEPYCAVQGEQAMWRAVIVQALMDAACGSQKEEALQWKQDALIWLRGTTKDFATVAHHAGFDPTYLREMIGEALTTNCQWRALPGEGIRKRPHRKPATREAGQRR